MCITIDEKNYDVTLHDFKTFANDHLGDAIFYKKLPQKKFTAELSHFLVTKKKL